MAQADGEDAALRAEAERLTAELRMPGGGPSPRMIIPRRAELLKNLISQDPKVALQMALSESELADLRGRMPDMADMLEKRGPFRGQLQTIIFDGADFKTSWKEHWLNTPQGRQRLHFADEASTVLKAGGTYELQGVGLDQSVAVSSSLMVAAPTASSVTPIGDQKIIALLVNFTDDRSEPISVADLTARLFGATNSLNQFWYEASYGKTTASGLVRGWYPSNVSKVDFCAGNGDVTGPAIAAAAADPEIDFTQFTRIFIVMPQTNCGASGYGQTWAEPLTTQDGVSYVTYAWFKVYDLGIFAHEAGHNFGLGHADAIRYFNSTGQIEAVGPLGTLSPYPQTYAEYGDPFDVMGGTEGHYNAPHKRLMGWLDPANIQSVLSSGTYVLPPYENTITGTQVLKIFRGSPDITHSEWLWIENRQRIGYDIDSVWGDSWGTPIYNGALVHREIFEDISGLSNPSSILLDFVPESDPFSYTSSRRNAPLVVGSPQSPWTDPYTGITLTPVSLSTGNLTVQVTYPALAVALTSPASGATYVNPARTGAITARFNRALNPATVSGTTFTLKSGSTTISATVSCSTPCAFAQLTPSSPLAYNTTYTATIKGTNSGVRDLSGGKLSSNYVWSFTTTPVPPTVTGFSPANGATDVSIWPPIAVLFSTAMDPTTINSTNFRLVDLFTQLFVPSTVTCNNPCTIAVMLPNNPLAYSNVYLINLLNSTIKDANGTPMVEYPTPVFVTRSSTNNGADLVISTVSGPPSVAKGSTATISNTVKNQGSGSASTLTVGVYLSTDAVIDRSDTVVGTRNVTSLAAGASDTVNLSVTIPGTLAAGTYYLGAIADMYDTVPESDDANNTKAGTTVEVAPTIDLVVNSASGPSSAMQGATITLTDTVANLGSDPVNANTTVFNVVYFLSTDNMITLADTVLGVRYVNGLGVGATSPGSLNVTIPLSQPGSTYYIGVIVDPANYVIETNENNNARAGNTIAITPAAPSNLTATAISRTQINLSWADNSTGELGFKIERSKGGTISWSQIATVGANVTSYPSTGLSRNTTYYYRVRAYNAVGDSAYSANASAKTLP